MALDAAPRMVELLSRDQPAAAVRLMDARELDLPDASFDLVVSGFALHIIPDGERAFSEMCRVLRPGGRLALVLPGREDGKEDPVDPLAELVDSFRRYATQGPGRTHNDVDEAELLQASALIEVTATTLEVAIAVPDGETYWRFVGSHGAGRTIDALPPDRRDQLRIAILDRAATLTDHELRRSATLWTATRPEKAVAPSR